MTTEGIRLEKRGSIALVLLDRPSRRNAFNTMMFDALKRVTAELEQALPRAVIVTGTGEKAFCAGFDVNPDNPLVVELYEAMEKQDRQGMMDGMKVVREAVDAFVSLPVPIIAAINGLAYGGGAELASRCDMRVMDKNAVICLSEVRLGLMPDWGGGAALAHLLGPAKAADLILSARKVGADEALQLGLANRVSAPGRCLDEALVLAGAICENGPQAVRHALAVIRGSRNMTLDQSLDMEMEKAVDLVASGECVHGITAFLEKRKAEFPDI
ncbi:enoyl-CoA hydratase/isomerase family protein [Desulfosudis oleivorans]|nr:enoyl-CoA hydratase/isomerase family protein [Desulfosudis oleivorans]